MVFICAEFASRVLKIPNPKIRVYKLWQMMQFKACVVILFSSLNNVMLTNAMDYGNVLITAKHLEPQRTFGKPKPYKLMFVSWQ